MGVIVISLMSTFSGVCNVKRTASARSLGFKGSRELFFMVTSVSTKPGEIFYRKKIKEDLEKNYHRKYHNYLFVANLKNLSFLENC